MRINAGQLSLWFSFNTHLCATCLRQTRSFHAVPERTQPDPRAEKKESRIVSTKLRNSMFLSAANDSLIIIHFTFTA